MIEELIVAAAVGVSLGNSWICALLSLSCSIDSRKGGVAFIAGRFLGLVLLGGAIAGLGLVQDLDPVYFLVTFGVLTVALGVFVLIRVLTRHSMVMHGHPLLRLLHRGRYQGRCERAVMADGGQIDFEADSKAKTAYVFLLGVVRGATPCVKIMVLAPLLISVDFGLAIGMVLIFAVASTIYPVIGFLSGNILRQSRKYALYMRVGAALLMIALGLYFVVNAFVSTHTGGQ
jgi:cadmium resistance protein CadD (predicted permease)